MKKFTITVFILLFILLGTTYTIGEILQKEIPKQLAKPNSLKIQTELISYQKSFLSAQMKLKVTLPIEGSEPLQLFVDSDINHYPYKVTSINHITLVDSDPAKKIQAFFNKKEWVTSNSEINLLGELITEVNLLNGAFESETESLATQPLNFVYKYNLRNNVNEFNLDWLGFKGKTPEGEFSAKEIAATYQFSHQQNTPLLNYQYQTLIKKFELGNARKTLSLEGVSLAGKNQVSDNLLTVNTSNDWKVKEYSDGVQIFTDNHINLHLSDLNLNALTLKRAGASEDISKQILSDLLNQGFNLDLQDFYSITPWGKVDGKLTMDIQPGMLLTQVVDNPFLLIDYVNGNLDLSLPQKLSEQAEVGDFLKMGTMSGVLKPEGEQLTVKSTLDRGELKINDRIIPM